MTKSIDTPRVKRTKPLFPIDIWTRRMPDEMQAFNFPCGETDCPEDANYELHIEAALGDEFVMPICYEHAMIMNIWIEKLSIILQRAQKAGITSD